MSRRSPAPLRGSTAAGGPMLAFDFGGTKVEVALAGPAQHVLARVTLATQADRGAEQVVERALAAARGLLGAGRRAAPAAVGVSTMGLTRDDGVDLAPNVPGWEHLRLPGIFRREFPGVPVELGNDVRAAAMAELKWGRLAGTDTGVYVNLGTGVAAALIIGGALFAGSHGAAGEIGYWLCPPPIRPAVDGGHPGGSGAGLSEGQSAGPEAAGPSEGPRAGPEAAGAAGAAGTLEAAVGGVGVRLRARALGLDGGLAELLAADDPRARSAADDVIGQICLHLTNLAIALDPQVMVLGGGYSGAGERILAVLRRELQRHCPFPPEATIGRFGADVGLYGAVALAEAALGRAQAAP